MNFFSWLNKSTDTSASKQNTMKLAMEINFTSPSSDIADSLPVIWIRHIIYLTLYYIYCEYLLIFFGIWAEQVTGKLKALHRILNHDN